MSVHRVPACTLVPRIKDCKICFELYLGQVRCHCLRWHLPIYRPKRERAQHCTPLYPALMDYISAIVSSLMCLRHNRISRQQQLTLQLSIYIAMPLP